MTARFTKLDLAEIAFSPTAALWEGGKLSGHSEVRDYWTRQFAEIDGRVEPVAIDELPDGRVSVDVQQTVRDLSGALLSEGRVRHVYTLRDGLVTRMDVVEG
jgi:hypothetical protein